MIYEDVTFESILQDALNQVPDTVDKREGSIIYDALSPACAELYKLYLSIGLAFDQCFGDTATNTYLERIASERAITRRPATYAVIQGIFEPSGVVQIGDRFNCRSVNYTVTGQTEDPTIMYLTCESIGEVGNISTGRLIPITSYTNLKSAHIHALTAEAEDEEDDESLRSRYFKAIDDAAFGGNVSDYIERVNVLDGVGGCHVIPVWNGGGTVKVIIASAGLRAPTAELVEQVQTALDPGKTGEGLGIAPIGHKVTVVAAEEQPIEVKVTVEFKSGWSWETGINAITEATQTYFDELVLPWEEEDTLIIRALQIESAIADVSFVKDVTGITLNGVSGNLTSEKYAIPVLKSVSALQEENS